MLPPYYLYRLLSLLASAKFRSEGIQAGDGDGFFVHRATKV